MTDRLGAQVRRAVELLIATLDRQDRDRHGELLRDLPDEEVYRGAVAVMMRLVFLFVAEERRLLPIDDPLYAETLAATTLRAQLQERADRHGEDTLEQSTAAWHRLLALFRAVHGGVEHDALRLPAYGGGLFDPDRYPFLEGRTRGSDWQAVAAGSSRSASATSSARCCATRSTARCCARRTRCAPSTTPRDDGSVHGAACHACQFASETSCERGNRFLDRAALVTTLADGVGYFHVT